MRPILFAAVLLLASPATAPAQTPSVGEVAFSNSGAPAAQAAFLRGLAQLHNFEYPSAAAAFREAQAADPGFALAYWGEAMTHNHPVWMEQDAAAARSALAKLAPTREARLAKARTPRERAYLDAVETLYGDGAKEERDRAYSARMRSLFEAHPDDVNARAFYALSLLGLAHKGRDIPLYMRAAGLLEEIFPQNQRHPGVLHYLIHSYDDPAHAPLGIRAARLYGEVAPEAGHALHMTSHIFLALGQWADVERANVQAMATVNRQRTAAGRPPAFCGHYNEWLIYARLQQRQPVGAEVAACGEAAAKALAAGPDETRVDAGSPIWSFSGMAIRQLIETGKSGEAPALPEGRQLAAAFNFAYGDLLAAGRDVARLRAARAKLEAASRRIEEARKIEGIEYALGPAREKVILMQAASLEQLAAGAPEEALSILRRAAEVETAIPAEFGPPLVEKPSWEMLGDVLLQLGRKAEAVKAYETALVGTPGRRLSLAGLEAARR